MAGWVGLVRDPCSAAVFAGLLRGGALDGVRFAGERGHASWADADGLPAGDDLQGHLVTVGGPACGAAVIDLGTETPGHPDPLSRALLEHRDAVPVTLRDRDGPLGTATVGIPPDARYPDLAVGVAATVAPWLFRAPRTPLPAVDEPATVAEPVEAWARIDWSAPAADVVAVIHAFAPPQCGAWTRLDDVRVVVGTAKWRIGAQPPGPPGLVLAVDADGIDVLVGDGVVRVAGLRDVVGPVDLTEIRPGSLLGRDLVAEVDRLIHRIHDLERLVRYLTAEQAAP